MISKLFSGFIRPVLIVIFTGLLLSGPIPLNAGSSKNTEKNIPADIQLVGIISPDGAINLWPVSTTHGDEIFRLLAKYPAKIRHGVEYYQVSAWKDLARILITVGEHHSRVIQDLASGLQQLNKRVELLENKRKRIVSHGALNHRVKILEDEMKDMRGSQNP